MFNFNVLSVRQHIRISRICTNFNCNYYTYRERALARLSTSKLCAVRCEPLTLLNRHFSDYSDGGAGGTVGKLSVMRVWWCRFHRI
jgi:hypothetical protein